MNYLRLALGACLGLIFLAPTAFMIAVESGVEALNDDVD